MSQSSITNDLMGGFECSTHRRRDGRRLDMIAATAHERFAREDYRRLAEVGIQTARDGLRWHLIEKAPGKCDFSSVNAQLEAAEEANVRVIWDLFHYGYPDYLNIFGPDFIMRFADFAAGFAEFHVEQTGRPPYVIPVNEISFFSWIAGEIGRFYPFAVGRGDELKRILISASIAAVRSLRAVSPQTRIMFSEPAIHVTARPDEPDNAVDAGNYRSSQYQAFDMLLGMEEPELGGGPECIDVLGINYYPHNQWFYPDREMIPLNDPLYRPLSDIIIEIYGRYRLPMLISETGTEDEIRPAWFRYVKGEYTRAVDRGVDLRGICLYPVVDHPGWEDERHCRNGLWGYPDETGNREIYGPLSVELGFFRSLACAAA